MNCPQCFAPMSRAKATDFGEEYHYCRGCKKELSELSLQKNTLSDSSSHGPKSLREFQAISRCNRKPQASPRIVIIPDSDDDYSSILRNLGKNIIEILRSPTGTLPNAFPKQTNQDPGDMSLEDLKTLRGE